MKLNEIKEPGFYGIVEDKDRSIIFEVYKNADEQWLSIDSEADLILDEWTYRFTDNEGRAHYTTNGDLKPIYQEDSNVDVVKISDTKYKICSENGLMLIEDKPSYKDLYFLYRQILIDLKNYQKRNCQVCDFYDTEKCNTSCQVYTILDLINKAEKDM